jgi:hypothetical protein
MGTPSKTVDRTLYRTLGAHDITATREAVINAAGVDVVREGYT